MESLSRARTQFPFIARSVVSFPIGLFLTIAVPLILLSSNGWDYFTSLQSINTFVALIAGVLIGRFFAIRIEYFPGVSSGALVLLANVAGFAVSGAILFFFYVDYSRLIFFFGAITAITWFLTINTVRSRTSQLVFSYVPGTRIVEELQSTHVEMKPIEDASDFSNLGRAVIADLRDDIPAKWTQFLAECALRGIPVYHVKHVRENLTGKVQIEHLSENTLGSILPSKTYLGFKRAVDTLLALALVIPTVLILMVVVPMMLIVQGRPIFFSQPRLGLGGREFDMVKLRTMLTPEQAAAKNLDDDRRRSSAETQSDDPRITPLGRFLRKYRIDELPQMFNVVKGDMSWIGPRPEAAVLGSKYEAVVPFYKYRYIVRPGISGWAQVNQGHVIDVNDIQHKLQYDFFYIKNISAWLDLLIVFRTFKVVLLGTGAK